MQNVNTYLNWRGDLNFLERAFAEVDALVLSMISYIDFEGVFASDDEKVTIFEACKRVRQLGNKSTYGTSGVELLLENMAISKRFKNARLSNYQTEYNEINATQFAAIHIDLDDETTFISFRGTDTSIIGWQEDFSLGSKVLPSQLDALKYINETTVLGRKYYVGGHSKGGNLSMYAAIHCQQALRDNILWVYNFDGPGLSNEIVQAEKYELIEAKLSWIVPEFSIIGMLFPYKGPSLIVASYGDSLLQHDALTWEVKGDRFVAKNELSESCKFYVNIFDVWVSTATIDQREIFTHEFFGALMASGAKTMVDVRHGGIDGFGTILISIVNSESRTKIVIRKFIASIIANCKNIDVIKTLRSKQMLPSFFIFFVGLFFVLFPSFSLQITGTVIGIGGMFFSVKKLLSYAMRTDLLAAQKKLSVLSWLATICAIELLIVNQSIILISSRVVLGIIFIAVSFKRIYLIGKNKLSRNKIIFEMIFIVVTILLGILTLISAGKEIATIYVIGSFLIIYAVMSIARGLYQSGINSSELE